MRILHRKNRNNKKLCIWVEKSKGQDVGKLYWIELHAKKHMDVL